MGINIIKAVLDKEYYDDIMEQFSRLKEFNGEIFIEQRKQQRERNKRIKETRDKCVKRWIKKNPKRFHEIQTISHHKRKALKQKLLATLTSSQWQEVLGFFNYQCAYCGMSEQEHLDKHEQSLHQEHFIALSRGGDFTKENIIPSCVSCNSSKRDRDFFEWYPFYEHYCKDREYIILDYLGHSRKVH